MDYAFETPPDYLEIFKQKYAFDEYLSMSKSEQQQWRFENIHRMSFDETVAFYEYCVQPEELRTGVQLNVDEDRAEAERRLNEIQQLNETLRNTIYNLEAENKRRENKLCELNAEQARRDAEWDAEQEKYELE